ncbi:MAG: hypothetical protein JXD22_16115 [Sedimentisphaerales bacterium]|nr:hypothetical protein [Sedimentisphaerales bacterium]
MSSEYDQYESGTDQGQAYENEQWSGADVSASEMAAAESAEQQYRVANKNNVNRSAVILLMTCLMGVGAIYLFGLRNKPKEATAQEQEVEAKVDQVLAKLVDQQKKDEARKMFQDTDNMVQVFYDYPAKQQVEVEELQRNPFSRMLAKDEGANDVDEALKRREQLRIELSEKSAKFVLQSVLQGKKGAKCLIDGNIYSEGDLIDSVFKVKKVNNESVILTAEEMDFVVQM